MVPSRDLVNESNYQIEKKKLLLVEGTDDQAVFRALCELIDVSDIQTLRYDGKTKLRTFIDDLRGLDGFVDVESIGVVIDADSDVISARDRVRGALENAGLQTPNGPLELTNEAIRPRVAFLVNPHENECGELEDVCLAAVNDLAALECVGEFMDCIALRGGGIEKMSKAKLQAYLSTRPDPDKRIGEAVQAGYLPYASEAFSPLRTLIELL